MTIVRSLDGLEPLGQSQTSALPNSAYCSATLFFDNIKCVERKRNFKLHIQKGDVRASFTLSKSQLTALGLDKNIYGGNGTQGYLTMPAFMIAMVSDKLKIDMQ